MTGFVCVAPSHRGLGLSRVMLDFAASILPRFGWQEMLRWTGAPAVYESSGVSVSEQEQRVTLHGNGAPDDCVLELSNWPPECALPGPGLAPFATATWQATLNEARIVFADTAQGPFLLDMHGEPNAVMRAMFASRRGDRSEFVSVRYHAAFPALVLAFVTLVISCNLPLTITPQHGRT